MAEKNSPIEFLDIFRITTHEFDELPEESRAVLAVASYAATEINALSRIYLFSAPKFGVDEEIDQLNLIQRFTLLRIISSKLFEFHDFLENLAPCGDDATVLKRIRLEALKKFRRDVSSISANLVRSIRHEATNHYSLKAAKKNLPHVSEAANLSIMAHEMDGNSFFPLGEEVLFNARLARYGQGSSRPHGGRELLDEWLSYNHRCVIWIRAVHHEISRELLLNRFPDKHWRRKMYFLEGPAVADFGAMNVPLFGRQSKGGKVD